MRFCEKRNKKNYKFEAPAKETKILVYFYGEKRDKRKPRV